MSADNGIYILKTASENPDPAKPEHGLFEYRVAHAMAIDNLYYDIVSGEDQKDFIPEMAFMYFGDCEVFTEMSEAMAKASELAENYSILEYGISVLDHSNQVFEKFTEEQLKAYNEETDMLIRAHQAERKARLDAKREAATLHLPAGTKVRPGTCNGVVFVTADGKELRGSLELPEVILTEDMDFLPHNWNEDKDF